MSLPINSLYSLTWGDYGTSLVSAVQLLRCHGDLVDCTLAAGGRSFPAHKIVLCAASPYLLELLKNTPCKHPVVMLAGVNANDLEALLEFVYRGEVSVDHSQLPSLLQAAHCLNIQGLAPQNMPHKDDQYTTSIQLHPTLMPHHVKIDVGSNIQTAEELITTIQAGQQEAVQAHVVEEILQEQIQEDEDPNKDMISQYLPTRKRKPRTKKPAQQNAAAGTAAGNAGVAKVARTTIKTESPQQAIEQQIGQHDPMEISTGSVTGNAPQTTTPANGPKKDGKEKPKSRSQSEQPASCPICSAVIRQSRNLRRHLELRHFSKPGIKKERKSKASANAGASTSGVNSGAATVAVTVAAPNQQPTIIETTAAGQPGQTQHVVTENADGTQSLQIAHVQGHQLTIGNLNQFDGDDQYEDDDCDDNSENEAYNIDEDEEEEKYIICSKDGK